MDSYYDTAQNDYLYLEGVKEILNNLRSYNPIAVTAQNIAERYLKHIIQNYMLDKDYTQTLRSHKLMTLYQAIHSRFEDFILDDNMLRILTDYYFDARYPGADYIMVTREDALEAIRGVETIKYAVDTFIEKMQEKEC